MSTTIERPTFYDGQILGADDLSETVGYARNQLARHDRYLHSWGIGCGFDLTTQPKTDAQHRNYVQVTVAAGLAYDGRGREIVLASPQPLDPTDFIRAHVYDAANPDPWYPVCVQGTTPASTSQDALLGTCAANGQATRQAEGVQFNFLPPGSFSSTGEPYDPPAAPGSADGPDPPSDGGAWNILIGFVQWDPQTGQFSAVQAHNDNGVSRRLAGVQAARVEARDGKLTMQTSNTPATRLMVVMQEAADGTAGSLTFGADDGQGGITKLLQITDKGDLSIAGTFGSNTPIAPGSVAVQSGIATDGMTLPLPTGVTDDLVSAGAVTLHVHVTPIVPDTLPVGIGLSGVLAIVPLGCYVDRNRRVRCRLRYVFNGSGMTSADIAGTCHYTVIATRAGGTSS
jgi:hypothetical protein